MDSTARLLMHVFLVTAMLGIGLQVGMKDVRSTLAKRSLLARSLVANFLFVPALGLLILRVVPMPADIESGFLMLALAPGGLGALQFTSRARGSLFYAGALTLVLAVLAVFVMPAVGGLLLPPHHPLPVPYGRALGFLFIHLLVPLAVGVGAHESFPGSAEKVGKLVALVATLTFAAWVIYLMDVRRTAIAALGPAAVAAMLAFIVGSMLIGLSLGGPDLETRAVLGSASSMRNGALCLLVATRDFPDTRVSVAVVAFSALMLPPNLLLTLCSMLLNRRKNIHLHARLAPTMEK